MRRREFLGVVGGAAATWPLPARAQQGERMRRIGVLTNLAMDDSEWQARFITFVQRLQQLGWTDGRNLRIEHRAGSGNPDLIRRHAEELVALAPDVIVANSSPAVAPLQRATQSVPIVFANIIDAVGAGFVSNLSRPDGNLTGFTLFEYGMSAKWIELLKEIAPSTKRAAIIRDPASPTGIGQLAAIQSVAPSFGIELNPIYGRDVNEIERAVAAFARASNGGLIVTPSSLTIGFYRSIVALVAQHRLPAIYPFRFFSTAGGLISYGPDTIEPFRQAASYVDRILKGEKLADLPVQAPTKYETVLNLKTAKALGLDLPATVLARADEVIE